MTEKLKLPTKREKLTNVKQRAKLPRLGMETASNSYHLSMYPSDL